MPFDLTVHRTDKSGSEVVSEDSYIMVGDGMSRYYIRGGHFWDESGNPLALESCPPYVMDAFNALSDEAKRTHGFDVDESTEKSDVRSAGRRR